MRVPPREEERDSERHGPLTLQHPGACSHANASANADHAQRVALIKNSATINEDLDPQLLIKRLKREIAELKDYIKQYIAIC